MGSCSPSIPPQYEKVDETEIDGTSRSLAFRRLDRGWVTLGEGWADETHLGVGRPDHPSRLVREPAHPRRRDRQDGCVRRPDGGHVAPNDARRIRGHRRQRAGVEGHLGCCEADPPPSGRAHRQAPLPEPGRALKRRAEVQGREAGEPAVRDLLRDRRGRHLRQHVRDREHADHVGDRADARDRGSPRARRLALAGPALDRRREPGDRPDRGTARDRRRSGPRVCASAGALRGHPGGRIQASLRRPWRRSAWRACFSA